MTRRRSPPCLARTLAVCIGLALVPGPVHAHVGPSAPAQGSPEAGAVTEADVRAALEAGDLTTARERAEALREAHPDDPSAHGLEAEVLEKLGDLDGARRARRAQLEHLPADAPERAEAEAALRRIDERARGRVEGEPPSRRTQPSEPPAPRAEPKTRPSEDVPPPRRDRIVTKWYFWVTVTAIVASAAAITGIAIKAARTGRDDALDAQAIQRAPAGIAVLRF